IYCHPSLTRLIFERHATKGTKSTNRKEKPFVPFVLFVANTLMSLFAAKVKEGCRWDIVSLGEVMLRLDPGEGRVSTTRHFQVWEGGGEYNVARGLKRCFGMDAAIVTALADNAVGRLVQD